MRWCNADGLLLRPDIPATTIDSFFNRMAFRDTTIGPNGEVWTSKSQIGQFIYIYVFAAELLDEYLFTLKDK